MFFLAAPTRRRCPGAAERTPASPSASWRRGHARGHQREHELHVGNEECLAVDQDEVLFLRVAPLQRRHPFHAEHLHGHAMHVGLRIIALGAVGPPHLRLVSSWLLEDADPVQVRYVATDDELRVDAAVVLRVLAAPGRILCFMMPTCRATKCLMSSPSPVGICSSPIASDMPCSFLKSAAVQTVEPLRVASTTAALPAGVRLPSGQAAPSNPPSSSPLSTWMLPVGDA